MNQYFVKRSVCPGCSSSRCNTLHDISYTEPPIQDYLGWYYKEIGPGIESHYLQGARYILDECEDCGLIFQKEIPNKELMARLYEHWLDPEILHRMEQSERGPGFYLVIATEIGRILRHLARPPSEIDFLDYGMGWGNWCLLAKGFGCRAVGVELSDARTTSAIKNGITVLNHTDLPREQFDFINAEQVFEHISNPLETLIKLKKTLKPGGVIRIGVPAGWDIKARLKLWDWQAQDESPRSLNAVAPLQHVNCFQFRSLRALGASAQLDVLELPELRAPIERPKDLLKLIFRPIYRKFFPHISKKRKQKTGTIYFTKN